MKLFDLFNNDKTIQKISAKQAKDIMEKEMSILSIAEMRMSITVAI